MAYIELIPYMKHKGMSRKRLIKVLTTCSVGSLQTSCLPTDEVLKAWEAVKFAGKEHLKLEVSKALDGGSIYRLENISHKSSKTPCNLQRDE